MRKILPFEKTLYLTKIDCKAEGDTITRQNQVIETKTKTFDFKVTRVQVPESSVMQIQHQMINTFFKIQKEVHGNSRACESNSQKIIYKKHSKCTISRKTSLVHSSLGKNYSGSRNIIYCKGVRNPVCKSPISGKKQQT